jgi:hypothetical protein
MLSWWAVPATHIVMLVFRKQGKELVQELDKLVCHLVQLVDIAVCVDEAEASTDRIVDEKKVRKFVPGAVIVDEVAVVEQAIWSNLHQRAIFGATAGPAVKPNNGALLVCDVLVLEVPEEEVAIVLGRDGDVSMDARQPSCQARKSWQDGEERT